MDNLEQTFREILTPQKIAAYLDVSLALSHANFTNANLAKIMLDNGAIIRDDYVPGQSVCFKCCFDSVALHHCFEFCKFGEIFHFSEEVRKNLHPQTDTSLKNLCQRTNDL